MKKLTKSFKISKQNLKDIKETFMNVFDKDFIKKIALDNNIGELRERKLNIKSYCFLMLFGFTSGKKLNYRELCNKCVEWKLIDDYYISKQAISQQIEKRGFDIFKKLFFHLIGNIIKLNRDKRKKLNKVFEGILSIDSTQIELIPKLFKLFKGRKEKNSMLKIHTKFDILKKIPVDIEISEGKDSDHNHKMDNLENDNILFLRDLGYYDFDFLESIDNSNNYFVSRAKSNIKYTKINNYNYDPVPFCKGYSINDNDLLVELANGFYTRLVRFIDKESGEERIYLTNLSHSDFSIEDIVYLYKLRWNIEIFFRDFKRVLGYYKLFCEKEDKIYTLIWSCLSYYLFIKLLMIIISYRTKIDYFDLSFNKVNSLFISIFVRLYNSNNVINVDNILKIITMQGDRLKVSNL